MLVSQLPRPVFLVRSRSLAFSPLGSSGGTPAVAELALISLGAAALWPAAFALPRRRSNWILGRALAEAISPSPAVSVPLACVLDLSSLWIWIGSACTPLAAVASRTVRRRSLSDVVRAPGAPLGLPRRVGSTTALAALARRSPLATLGALHVLVRRRPALLARVTAHLEVLLWALPSAGLAAAVAATSTVLVRLVSVVLMMWAHG